MDNRGYLDKISRTHGDNADRDIIQPRYWNYLPTAKLTKLNYLSPYVRQYKLH